MKASTVIETEALESKLDVKAFRELQVEQFVSFNMLPKTGGEKSCPKTVMIQHCNDNHHFE